jgi:hypothetical protein
MLKPVALLGAIAALALWNPANSVAQEWGGDGGGWDGGGWRGGGCCGVTVTVSTFPAPFRRPVRCCARPFIPRPAFCCERPFIPRPTFCCERRFFRPFFRPPYFYGDNFAPYAYNWNAGYGYDGYGGW